VTPSASSASAASRRRSGLPAWSWALPFLAAVAGSLAFAPEMTYAQFHLTFTLPWLALLAAASFLAARHGVAVAGDLGRGDRFAAIALAVHALIAFVYTTPWDNYLVYLGVWGYPPGRVLGTIGYVPVEEYAFFLIQTLGTGLFLFALARALGPQPLGTLPPRTGAWVRAIGAALLLAAAAVGVILLGTERGTYMGLITAWALPVVALQWGFGGDLLVRRWRIVALGVMIPTLYLWVADALAIGWSIWWIAPAATLGWRPFGLPIEEAVFFLVTNVLVVFGMVLALHPSSMGRLRGIVAAGAAWRPLLALWAITMIPAPLLDDGFAVVSYVATTLLASAVLLYAWSRYGRVSLVLFGVAFVFGVLVEAIGAATGVPFGAYAYTAPGPTLLGVPLLVPLGWWAFTLIAIAVAPAGRALLVAPLALVAWDAGLDPLMVQQGFWAFDAGGAYHGVPISNFVGWFVAGFVLVALLTRIEPRLSTDTSSDLRAVYLVQAFLIGAGLIMFGLPLAALVAVSAMLAVASTWWWLPSRRPEAPGARP
jgi:lycopene beta-cyclase